MDTLFFWISKIAWMFISPVNLLIICLFLLWILILLKRTTHLRILFSAFMLAVIFMTVVPLGSGLLLILEKRFPHNPLLPETVGGIIVLGGAINPERSKYWQQVEVNASAERLLTFMRLARRYEHTRLIYTGGSGRLHADTKDADVAKILFFEQGLDVSRIVFERESRNTYENVINSLALLEAKPTKPWILITSAFHMPRSVGIFCKQGWPVIPLAVDHTTQSDNLWQLNFYPSLGNLYSLNSAIHEWLGLLVYRLTGKTTAFFPNVCT